MVYRIVFIPNNQTWLILEKVIDFLFFIDILVSMISAYKDENGVIITARKMIFWNYLTGWFIVDFIAIIPIEIFD